MHGYKDVENSEAAIEALQPHFCSYNARQLERLVGHVYKTLNGRMQGMLRPTEVGKLLSPAISARGANILMHKCGLLKQVDGAIPYGSDTPKKEWKLTQSGMVYGEEFSLGTKQFPNQSACQIRWHESVVEKLQKLANKTPTQNRGT